uniref:hypothetical protein n=1 Tax=Streptomyces corallincola TaxID=2851888 RepID=UPI0027E330C0|nr:hypothetical protein [Streptomyces corallincola]
MSAPRPTARPAVTGVPMRDLLASCAAAAAVSRPPRLPEPGTGTEPETGTGAPVGAGHPEPHTDRSSRTRPHHREAA